MSHIAKIFDVVDQESVTGRVMRQIETMIVEGVLQQNDRLPSERELSDQMGVSRPKVREALKQMADRGLLTIRQGDGTFVAPLTGEAMLPALIDLYARHGTAFRDYLEYRREQEGFAARLAAQRRTAADRDTITALMDELEEAHTARDLDRSAKTDVEFHAAIAWASHNVMLIHMMRSIYDLTRRGVFYNRHYLRSIDGTSDKLMAQHRRIAKTVLAGDPEEAEAAAKAHLDFVDASYRDGRDAAERERFSHKRRIAAGFAPKA